MTQERAQIVFELLYTAYRTSGAPERIQVGQWYSYIGESYWSSFGRCTPTSLRDYNQGQERAYPFYPAPPGSREFKLSVVNARGCLNVLVVNGEGKLVTALIWRDSSPWWVLVDFEDGTTFGCERADR